jgi:hypothetical protein
MNIDAVGVGTSAFTTDNVAADAPFGDIAVDLGVVDVDAVGGFLASLNRDQVVETLQRCRVITENMATYSVEVVAFCNTVFDIVEPTTSAAAPAEIAPGAVISGMILRESPEAAMQQGPGYQLRLQAQPEATPGPDDAVRFGWWSPQAGNQPMVPGGAMHPGMIRFLMILLDADGDGALSLQELQPVLERLFRAMDSDGDGLLTLGEIHAFRPMEQAPSQR